MKILITLCARGGSKGIPLKNIKLLNGLPLIGYSVKVAKAVQKKYPDSILELSTDDDEILNVAKQLGIETEYKRPEVLGADTAGKVDVIKDLLFYAEKKYYTVFDMVLDLDISSPLRTLQDIEKAIEIFQHNKEALTLFSVNDANKNPYFNMVEENDEGYFSLSKMRSTTTLSRQSAPKVYELNASFYLYRRSFFNMGLNGVITDKSLIYNMNHVCFDLDHMIDFEFMEFLLSKKKLSFSI